MFDPLSPGDDPFAFRPPPLPATFVARPAEYARLKGALLAADTTRPVAITTALPGAGGFGKTVLAAALCADPAVREAFPDGVVWVTLGEQPAISPLLIALATHVLGPGPGPTDPNALAAALAAHWQDRRALLVLDDAWQTAALHLFLAAGQPCARLVTTRNLAVVPDAEGVCVDAMPIAEATALLAQHLGAPPVDQALLVPLARRLGAWPLLLALAGAALRDGLEHPAALDQALAALAGELTATGVGTVDGADATARRQAVAGIVTLSLSRLAAEERARCQELAIFPAATALPLEVVAALWGTPRPVAEATLARLADQALLAFDPPTGTIRLHDVIRADLIGRLADPAAVHGRLVDAWGDPYQLPGAYAWRQLGYHLAGAGRAAAWRALRLDATWLAAKLAATDAAGLLADYADAGPDPDLSLVGGALRLALPALAADPAQLAGQLRGRLLASERPAIQALVAAVRPPWGGLWLRPLAPVLVPPNPTIRHTLLGHTGVVTAVALTGDGTRAVSASEDRTLRVWDLASGAAIHILAGHRGEVEAVAVTADGTRTVSASRDGTLRVWDLASGALLQNLAGHTHWVTAVALTGDGTHAVSASWDHTLRVWDLGTGALLQTLQGHTDDVLAVAVTPDGAHAVSGARNSALRIWDLRTGAARPTHRAHTGAVGAVAVTRDGQRAVSGAYNGTLRVWDLHTGAALYALRGHTAAVRAIAVTADGARAVTAARDGTLWVWDLGIGAPLHTLRGHGGDVTAVAVTADGARAVSGATDQTVRVWDLATGALLRTLAGHTRAVTAVVVTADGASAVSAASDSTLQVWDLAAAPPPVRLADHTDTVEAVVFIPGTGIRRWLRPAGHTDTVEAVAIAADGALAVSAARDHTLRVWDLASGATLHTLQGHTSAVLAVAVTPDGQRAVSGADERDRTLRVWDLRTGAALHTLWGHTGDITAIAVTADGARAVSTSWDRTLRVWDLHTGAAIHTLAGHTDAVRAVALTADGARAVSASVDGTLRVWDLGPGACLHTLEAHTWAVFPVQVALTGDGTRAVEASRDGTLRVWDLGSGALLQTLTGHTDVVAAVAVTGDGTCAVSGSRDGTLRVWDLASGTARHILAGHTGAVRALAVTTDGARAVSAAEDHTLRVWDLRTGAALARFDAESSMRCAALTPDGRWLVAGDNSEQVHLLTLEEA
ncbi:MAG TPA: NB-ARC domain-containing protein [Chloroflexia bacterium]|nr:NB-ARC domain-containing protein [Chloroflexia bacterium]